jgi:hypothetical protein
VGGARGIQDPYHRLRHLRREEQGSVTQARQFDVVCAGHTGILHRHNDVVVTTIDGGEMNT